MDLGGDSRLFGLLKEGDIGMVFLCKKIIFNERGGSAVKAINIFSVRNKTTQT